MLIRYSPGKFDEKIPVPVQKKITFFEDKNDDEGYFIFEITGGRKQEVKLDECTSLMSGGNRLKTWLKLGGLFVLLIAFCAGSCNIIFRVYTEGYAALGCLSIIQFIISLALVGYLAWMLKVNIERYLYGGLTFSLGEIYFQSDKEKSFFNEILKNERRKNND